MSTQPEIKKPRQWLGVRSSQIKFVWYDLDRAELWVQFAQNSIYLYFNVAAEVVTQIVFADSVGKAFNRIIKGGGYLFERISGPDLEVDPGPIATVTHELCEICNGDTKHIGGICTLCKTAKADEAVPA